MIPSQRNVIISERTKWISFSHKLKVHQRSKVLSFETIPQGLNVNKLSKQFSQRSSLAFFFPEKGILIQFMLTHYQNSEHPIYTKGNVEC